LRKKNKSAVHQSAGRYYPCPPKFQIGTLSLARSYTSASGSGPNTATCKANVKFNLFKQRKACVKIGLKNVGENSGSSRNTCRTKHGIKSSCPLDTYYLKNRHFLYHWVIVRYIPEGQALGNINYVSTGRPVSHTLTNCFANISKDFDLGILGTLIH